MLIHLAPKCYSPWITDVALVSVELPELSMVLHEGEELRARRPYPNKGYLVASAAKDRAAKDGFFIEAVSDLKEFHVISRWAVNADAIFTTQYKFTVLDKEFDAVSHDATLWYGLHKAWGNRWPREVPDIAPTLLQPVLKIDQYGNADTGQDQFLLPSLERARVLELAGSFLPGNRNPGLENVFIG